MLERPLLARDVKVRADIVAIAGSFTKLRRAGSQWRGLCPLPDHRERHPSFFVHPRGVWYCQGCSRGGDVFRLVMLARGCSFPAALRFVAEFAPVVRPPKAAEPGRRSRPALIARIRERAREPKVTDGRLEARPLPPFPCFLDAALQSQADPILLEIPNKCAGAGKR